MIFFSGTPGQHEKTPVKSESRVDFLVNENVGSDDPSKTLYKLHGNLKKISRHVFFKIQNMCYIILS